MPRSALDSEEAKQAQMEALRGAGVGALRFGSVAAVLGGLGYVMSPVYRGLTIQFKVYIQMSSMILGGMIEADSGMRRYEQRVRMQRMMARDRAMRQELLDEDEEFAATATETSAAKK